MLIANVIKRLKLTQRILVVLSLLRAEQNYVRVPFYNVCTSMYLY